MNLLPKLRLLARSGRAFATDRKGGPAVEFALVGLAYLTLLIVVIQGGIYYLRVTVLDYATEVAARAIMIDDNPGSSVVAPTNATDLINDIAASSFGILNSNNIAVSVKLCAPIGSTAITNGAAGFCTGGFESPSMSTQPFDATNSTFQYVPGVCTGVSYVVGAPGTSYQQIGQVKATSCTQNCAVTNNNLINGELEGGTQSYSVTSGITFENVSGAKYICSAQQDILLQVQYTDRSLLNIAKTPLSSGSFPFSTITSTITFQVEPSTT